MRPNYFTIHKNKKAKKAKYSNPYTKQQLESLRILGEEIDREFESIRNILETLKNKMR